VGAEVGVAVGELAVLPALDVVLVELGHGEEKWGKKGGGEGTLRSLTKPFDVVIARRRFCADEATSSGLLLLWRWLRRCASLGCAQDRLSQ
jgi:hypothetical protein